MEHGRPDSRVAPDWIVAAAVMAIAAVLAALVLDLGSASLSVPFAYSADANSAHMVVKGVLEHGWYQDNPDLGWPFGQDLRSYAFVSGDNLQIVLIKAIGLLGFSPAATLNIFFLLGFPLCALAAYVVLRLWRVGQIASAIAAILFAILPFHFLHGQEHLFISAYYGVPLGVFLVVAAWRGDALLPAGGRGRTALVVAACVVVGSAFVYYAAFTIVLAGLAVVVRALTTRDVKDALRVAIPAGVVLLVVVVNHAPNVVYNARHGKNEAFARTPPESEQYGLKGAAMVLPVSDHRLGPLADLRGRYDRNDRQSEEGPPQALGTAATAGFLGLFVVLLAGGAALLRRRPPPLAPALAATAVTAFVMGTAGGGSLVFAFLVTPELRAWSRISVFIAFCGLAAGALALDWLARRRQLPRALVAAVAVGLVTLGAFDQTTPAMAPDHDSTRAVWESEEAFVEAIERRLPEGSAVFGLPYQAFPEPQIRYDPPPGAAPYDGVRPYLHSEQLAWSFGDVKGLNADWQFALASAPASLIPPIAAATGYRGVVFDRGSYLFEAAAIEDALAEATGAPALESSSGRFVFYALDSLAERLRAAHGAAVLERARAATLRPLAVDWLGGFSEEKSTLTEAVRLGTSDARIFVENATDRPRTAVFDARIETASGDAAALEITWPGAGSESIRLAPAARVSKRFRVPPGGADVQFRTDADTTALLPDVRLPFSLRLIDPMLVDARQADLVDDPRPSPPATLLTPYGKR